MIRSQSRPVAVLAFVAVFTLVGCTPTGPSAPNATEPSQEATEPTPAASMSAATSAAAPTLSPAGSAADNLPLFTQVVRTVWGSPDQVAGRAYIDALVGAGFDKAAMQVTPDQTTIGNPAESIEFSVRWGADCLVGQVGPSIGEPVTTVLPGLSTGGCLIGETRAIDW
ncbi:hypothetical protein [Microbacterium sp. B19]|uniref:DUF6993 domain-containing protein n=1 Tax=Microbacterium sp. B19 TaxID=96765 RepID=UPI0003493196|nr:hypothetical protein [Microbacterium sp. B19]